MIIYYNGQRLNGRLNFFGKKTQYPPVAIIDGINKRFWYFRITDQAVWDVPKSHTLVVNEGSFSINLIMFFSCEKQDYMKKYLTLNKPVFGCKLQIC